MRKHNHQKTNAERFLERFNKPILVLASVAVLLYILELFRVVPPRLFTAFLWVNFLIDLIFLVDLIAKCVILGQSYLRSPWFLIDTVSTLPIISSALEVLGSVGPQLQATRVARAARIARIARITRLVKVARVARLVTAIRARHGLTFLKTNNLTGETPAFNKALMYGVPVLLAGFIVASMLITDSEVSDLRREVNTRLRSAQDQQQLDAVVADFAITPQHPPAEIETFASPLAADQRLALSLSSAYEQADRISGILLLVVLLTIGVSIYISGSLARDRSVDRERSILSQCFSPAIVKKFYSSPEVVERFYNQWMTVFFIDIRGFTQAAERDTDDVEGLALKLRQVMDTARREIVVTHEGVIDKFMGDAVMGWVGGHFSAHWDLLEGVRRQLRLDELALIEQDIRSIERETTAQGGNGQAAMLRPVLQEAHNKKSELLEQQRQALADDEGLESKLQELTTEYRRRVARSAVTCCLKISQQVEKIDDPEAFHELKIGIGSGPVLVGNFGSTEQIGFTVLGPTVNRSARLEPASAQCGCKMLVDQMTFELLRGEEDLRFRRVPRISVRGISKDMVTYEPFFTGDVSESFLQQFEEGVTALEAGDIKLAQVCFAKADGLRSGGDVAARLWSDECTTAIERGETMGVKAMKK